MTSCRTIYLKTLATCEELKMFSNIEQARRNIQHQKMVNDELLHRLAKISLLDTPRINNFSQSEALQRHSIPLVDCLKYKYIMPLLLHSPACLLDCH